MSKRHLLMALLVIGVSCGQARRADYANNPTGYDLGNPEVFELTKALDEISGISFKEGDPDTIYAQQDEDGELFYFTWGDQKPKRTKFGKPGDYEDIAVLHEKVVILRSDGSLYRFSLAEKHRTELTSEEWKTPFPAGEYESLAATPHDSLLYVLCKNCKEDKKRLAATGYAFRFGQDGALSQRFTFAIHFDQIEQLVPLKGKSFQPSAMAWNPFTRQWFVIASINKLLVILDEQWHVTSAHRLDPKIYTQPEGIAFDANRNLYISNEKGKKGNRATIFKFQFSS
ncbi:SdiA-regulated family protein [Parapedobacter sp. ISTM3]|uniref:SdiA-regulated family protein n=1 Tax=Parapedobacter sp. ISTM3 TaxID=2800130 RepID=UPI0019074650|nr:SdiA-regulated family protein [Parapedobacter sp. ISTM3]MBK1440061.1 SdiA-regulated family protein [Parapedobacter sp. ISTM3]